MANTYNDKDIIIQNDKINLIAATNREILNKKVVENTQESFKNNNKLMDSDKTINPNETGKSSPDKNIITQRSPELLTLKNETQKQKKSIIIIGNQSTEEVK